MKAPPPWYRSRRRIRPRTTEPFGIKIFPLRTTSTETLPSISVPTASLSEIGVVSCTVISSKAGTAWPEASGEEGIGGDPDGSACGGGWGPDRSGCRFALNTHGSG